MGKQTRLDPIAWTMAAMRGRMLPFVPAHVRGTTYMVLAGAKDPIPRPVSARQAKAQWRMDPEAIPENSGAPAPGYHGWMLTSKGTARVASFRCVVCQYEGLFAPAKVAAGLVSCPHCRTMADKEKPDHVEAEVAVVGL